MIQGDLFPEQLEQTYRAGDCFDMSAPPLRIKECDKFWVNQNKKRIDFLLDLPKDLYYIFRDVDGKPAIFNKKRGKYLTPSYSRDIYPAIRFKGKTFYIHTLVAIFFLENTLPQVKCMVDHINHDPWDYSIDNLEWVSCSENTKRGKREDRPLHGFNRQTGKTL